MSRFVGQDESIHQQTREQSPKKIGVLLTNLGTPDAPTTSALKRYLREFLSDPRVVEIPRLVWLVILHGIILRVRPAKSAKLYQSIWTDQGSPLMVHSLAQKNKVAEKLTAQYGEHVLVDVAMRYGKPSIKHALQKFQQAAVSKIVILPLYPQYAGPTTASTFDAVVKEVQQWRWIPSINFISSYHDQADYIQALANSITEHIAEHGKPDKLVLSYHGMPELFLKNGDPYYCFCHKTTRLLAENLGLNEDDFVMTFQSRFGKAEWLKPYTDATLAELAKAGNKHVAIISPAFSADCLETLEELVAENREVFIEAGGDVYHYIACLNDRDDHINAITKLIAPSLIG